jgi:hypothetical protein
MPIVSQFGAKKETVYGTAVTVDRFFEFSSEKIKLETGRAVSEGLRSGQRVERTDRFVPFVLGAAGPWSHEPASKGFGFWLEHMLGSVATTGPTDSAYTHTGTIGDLWGKSFTAQGNRPLGPAGTTDQAFTWSGGKVVSWTLSCEKERLLTFEADFIFADQSTATALASASYPASTEVMSWARADCTIAGTAVPVTKWSVKVDNHLKTDRHFLQGSTRRAQSAEEAMREITVECEADWDSLTQYNRFKAETAAGTLASIVVTAKSPTLIGATTYPGITITMPNVRFDDVDATVDGPGLMMQAISGKALSDGSAQPISVAYTTLDATP